METGYEFRVKTQTGCTLIFTDCPIYDGARTRSEGYHVTILDACGLDMDQSHYIYKADIKRLAKAS